MGRGEPLTELARGGGIARLAQPLELADIAREGAGADVGGARGELVADGGGRGEVGGFERAGKLRQGFRAARLEELDELRIEVPASVAAQADRKSTRLNSSHRCISYAVFCLKEE